MVEKKERVVFKSVQKITKPSLRPNKTQTRKFHNEETMSWKAKSKSKSGCI